MNRTLRALAIIALLSLGLFIALVQVLDRTHQPTMGSGFPSAIDLLLPAIPSMLVNLIGQTGSALCLAVGVAAIVACIQRRQPAWAVVLIAMLFVAANGTSLAVELAPFFDFPQSIRLAPYVGLLLTALVPLVVLGYTFAARPRLAPPIQPAALVE